MARPVIYKTPKQMQDDIDNYFSQCTVDERPLTISGLAYALNMTTETLRVYSEKGEFSATVKRAKQKVEIYLEERLDGSAPVGAIFNLKNNFGWKDKVEQDVKVETKDVSAIDAVKQLIDSKLPK